MKKKHTIQEVEILEEWRASETQTSYNTLKLTSRYLFLSEVIAKKETVQRVTLQTRGRYKSKPIGHRELIIYPIDPNGETLVFDSLFCISQHMWGSPYALSSSQNMNKRNKKGKKHTFTRSFFNYCMLCNA